MFGFMKDRARRKLEKAYRARLEEAMRLQRNGDIRGYSLKTEEAEALRAQLDTLE